MMSQTETKPEEFMAAFVEAVRRMYVPDDAILRRATPRWEYRKCHDGRAGWFSACRFCRIGQYCQGPYLYLYWKENGKLKKKYLGKKPEKYLSKKVEKCYSRFEHLGNQRLQGFLIQDQQNNMTLMQNTLSYFLDTFGISQYALLHLAHKIGFLFLLGSRGSQI